MRALWVKLPVLSASIGAHLGGRMRVEKRVWLSQENKRPGHQKLPSPRTVWRLSTPSLIFTLHSRRCFYLGEVRQLWKLGLEQLLPGEGRGRLPWGLCLTSLTPVQEGQDRGPSSDSII